MSKKSDDAAEQAELEEKELQEQQKKSDDADAEAKKKTDARTEWLAFVNRQHKVLTLQSVQELEVLIDKYFPA
jgi:hypothetical protein